MTSHLDRFSSRRYEMVHANQCVQFGSFLKVIGDKKCLAEIDQMFSLFSNCVCTYLTQGKQF